VRVLLRAGHLVLGLILPRLSKRRERIPPADGLLKLRMGVNDALECEDEDDDLELYRESWSSQGWGGGEICY